ncbi:MAG: ABC transporter permease, partial [Sphingobacteriaceae bacterium]
MLKHYLTMGIRKLRKNIFYTLISIVGLAIAMGAFVILMNYVSFESDYDAFLKDSNKIYRAEAYFSRNGTVTDSWATSAFGYAPAMKTAFPEVKEITRISNHDYERMVRYKNVIYREPRVVLADSNFFSFFSYPLIKGDAKTILKEPNTIAISASAAKKYFGNENPIGKILEISTYKNSFNYSVSGVFADFPSQSHLHLNLIISYSSATPFLQTTWYIHEAYTYVKTANAIDARSIEKKFPQLAEKYKTADVMRDKTWGINMVPLTEIHLNPIKPYEFEPKGSRQNIQFLFLFGIIILIVGWVNFINIMTSNAIERAGEIGIRKVAGANTGHLVVQFMWESVLINFAAIVLFLLAAFTFLPVLEHLYGSELFYRFWKQPLVWKLILSTFLMGTFITGTIPVLILKDVKTALVLKNNMAFKSGMGNGLRQGLIVFQYSAAIILIVATITIRKQMNFMQSHHLGIEVDQTLVFKTPTRTSNYDQKLETIVQRLKTLSGVKAVTLSSAVPGKMVGYGMANHRENDPDKVSKLCEMLRVDYDFLNAYNLHLLKGRNFSADFATDTSAAVILTQNAMHLFGFKNEEDAVNNYVSLEG